MGWCHCPQTRGCSAGRGQWQHPQTLPGVQGTAQHSGPHSTPPPGRLQAAVQWSHHSRHSSGKPRPGQAPHLAPQVQCPGPACALLILFSWEPIKCISQALPQLLCASCPPPQALPAQAWPAPGPATPTDCPAREVLDLGSQPHLGWWRRWRHGEAGVWAGSRQATGVRHVGWAFPAGPLATSRPGDPSSQGLWGKRLGLDLDSPGEDGDWVAQPPPHSGGSLGDGAQQPLFQEQ